MCVLFVGPFEFTISTHEYVTTHQIEHAVIQLEEFPAGRLHQGALCICNRVRKRIPAMCDAIHQRRQIHC